MSIFFPAASFPARASLYLGLGIGGRLGLGILGAPPRGLGSDGSLGKLGLAFVEENEL